MLINIFFCDGKFRLEIKKSDFKILDYIQEAKIAATDTYILCHSLLECTYLGEIKLFQFFPFQNGND